jgi:hypothetical protein
MGIPWGFNHPGDPTPPSPLSEMGGLNTH